MRTIFLASVAALTLVAVPGIAQTPTAEAYDMNTTQQQMFMNWPDDRRIAYTRWPAEVQAYYWTLNPQEQNSWWVLTDDQRVRIYAMTPVQRAQAWTAIAAQMAGNMTNQAASATAATTTGNIRWVSNAVVQQIPPPHQGEYPVCKSDADDNCMNPWEAGLRGPNVERPLSYWPGEPASER